MPDLRSVLLINSVMPIVFTLPIEKAKNTVFVHMPLNCRKIRIIQVIWHRMVKILVINAKRH